MFSTARQVLLPSERPDSEAADDDRVSRSWGLFSPSISLKASAIKACPLHNVQRPLASMDISINTGHGCTLPAPFASHQCGWDCRRWHWACVPDSVPQPQEAWEMPASTEKVVDALLPELCALIEPTNEMEELHPAGNAACSFDQPCCMQTTSLVL